MTRAPKRPPRRRTQAERKGDTIGKLLDATVAALSEVGYTRTTVQEVSSRAGVSVGGLFRHFASRLDLLIAAAEHVRMRQFAAFRAGLEQLATISVLDCLRLLRAGCRAPINTAWYELLGAARSDAALRARLAPVAARYHAEIAALGRSLPIAGEIAPALVDTVLFTMVHVLDGEALSAVVHAQPEQEELRLELLAEMVARAQATPRTAPRRAAPRRTARRATIAA
ncbi:MAG: TetR/AcrR family transcriptional regulator [Deltaproteobacteria bacterium]|nr:TetR/AcrR family transcriptional regulator [Deltaproteobacteria bacterium]